MEENNISYAVRGIVMDIHTEYGPGLLEKAYEKILVHRLIKNGYGAEAQVPIHINEDGMKIKAFYADIVVDERVIIELKAVDQVHKVHFKQLSTYLKLTGLKLGMLINFKVEKIHYHGIHRIVNGL